MAHLLFPQPAPAWAAHGKVAGDVHLIALTPDGAWLGRWRERLARWLTLATPVDGRRDGRGDEVDDLVLGRTVAAEAQPTGSEAANPPSRDVVSVAYRRGFDRIVVTTRATGAYRLASPDGTGSEAGWDDPVASGEGFIDEPERFTVATGKLAGARAELVLSPRGVPHAWTFDDELVTTAACDASAEELRRMVESFRPVG